MEGLRLIIDFHVHPLFDYIIEEEGILKKVRDIFYLRTTPEPVETLFAQMEIAGIDKAVLLPIDCETTYGCKFPSNEATSSLVDKYPDKFVGFASVDPHKEDVNDVLDEAVKSLGLKGVKLSPPLQRFSPSDKKTFPIYDKAEELRVPIVFHCGMFWQKFEKISVAKPLLFEDVALSHPDLRIVLTHFGFPWVWEAAMLAMKYPNIYVDLANVYTTTPYEHLELVLMKILGKRVVESCLEKKILFGSCFPRIETDKMVRALKKLPLEEKTLNRIFSENARKILGL